MRLRLSGSGRDAGLSGGTRLAPTTPDHSDDHAGPGPSPGPVCFIHIPKTAGTSLRKALWTQYPPAQVFPNEEDIARNGQNYPPLKTFHALPAGRRAGTRLIAAHYLLTELQPRFPAARYVTFLRDPVDRTLSEVLHVKKRMKRFADLTEEQVIATLARHGRRFGLNQMCRYLGLIYPFTRHRPTPQDIAASAMLTVRDMAAFGIYEQFDASVALIAAAMGWNLPKIGRLNVTSRRLAPARRAELAELIRPHVAIDQMLYDYAVGEFAKRLDQAGLTPKAQGWLSRLARGRPNGRRA